jgi:hypothetical protein
MFVGSPRRSAAKDDAMGFAQRALRESLSPTLSLSGSARGRQQKKGEPLTCTGQILSE